MSRRIFIFKTQTFRGERKIRIISFQSRQENQALSHQIRGQTLHHRKCGVREFSGAHQSLRTASAVSKGQVKSSDHGGIATKNGHGK